MPRYHAVPALLLIALLTGCAARQPTAIVAPAAVTAPVAATVEPASTPFVSPLATATAVAEEAPPSSVHCASEGETARCTEADATVLPAAAQFFERGFMVWTETPDRFYVFLTEEERPQGETLLRFSAPYDFGPEQPLSDTPPLDRLAPVSGFGRLWRGELSTPLDDDLRDRLGWAVGPEFAFESALQCETREHLRSWTCYLLGPDDRVLRLWPDSTAQANPLWRAYGAD